MTPVARLLSPLVLMGTMVVAMGGAQSEIDAIALTRTGADAHASTTVQAFSMLQGHRARTRVVAGARDGRGCASLAVRRGRKVLLRIPSHDEGCSSHRRQIRIGGYLYFDWGVTRKRGGDRQRRTDVWVTDGTRAGTVRLAVLRNGSRRSIACAARWQRVGGVSVAGAEWCWNARTKMAISGSIRILTLGRFVRRSPIPDMQRFAVAGRRMVTTGADRRGRELWLHDSQMVRLDLRPGRKGSNPRRFDDRGRKVRFIANDGSGTALWVTDGTVAGTHRVRG